MTKGMKKELLFVTGFYFIVTLMSDYFIEGDVNFAATIAGTIVFGLIISLGSVILKDKKKKE